LAKLVSLGHHLASNYDPDTGNRYVWVDGAWVREFVRVQSVPYTYDISEGNVGGHSSWSKIGFNAAIGATESSDQTTSDYGFDYFRDC
jgi:hypothetical protein